MCSKLEFQTNAKVKIASFWEKNKSCKNWYSLMIEWPRNVHALKNTWRNHSLRLNFIFSGLAKSLSQ
jgi:hypothetical protein